MRQFWLARDGRKTGPFGEDTLRSYLARGDLLPSDLLWADGMPEWRPAPAVLGAGADARSAPARAGVWARMRMPAPSALVVIAVIFALLVPIGAMVAAIAIPAYTDYTVRAGVAEALAASAGARIAVHEYIEANGTLPRSLDVAGVRFIPTPHLSGLALDARTASLTLTLGFEPLEGKTIVLAPRRDDARNMTWACLAGTAPGKYLPRSCRGE